ncbi:MAG: hypothetical protein J7M38_04945, partial [Armatimonadetes bacterium]|nr:hypothetical protein [Armatimonadota bacterium]
VEVGEGWWSCEWAIPLNVITAQPDKLKSLMFNIGVRHVKTNRWLAWVGTGAEIFRVDSAGVLDIAQ